MPEQIVPKYRIEDAYRVAVKTMTHEEAVDDIAGRFGHDPVVIEGVVASIESRLNAAEALA